MKKKTALIGICAIAASTLALTFIQPTIIHQLVIWVAGMFAVLVVLAVFAVDNIAEGGENKHASRIKSTAVSEYDKWVIDRTKKGRELGVPDEVIAETIGADIDVIKAIPR